MFSFVATVYLSKFIWEDLPTFDLTVYVFFALTGASIYLLVSLLLMNMPIKFLIDRELRKRGQGKKS